MNTLKSILCAVLVCTLFPSLRAQGTATSPAVGVLSTDVPSGLSGAQFPIIPGDALVSLVAGHVDAGVVGKRVHEIVMMSVSTPASVMMAGTSYYLEVTAGALAGERFEVDEVRTAVASPGVLVLDLDDANSTQPNMAAGALVGMKAAIRPHMTLARLQARITPALVGNNVASQADGVLIFNATSAVTYYLRTDGVTWRKAGSTTDFSGLIIPPDQSIMLQMRSGAKELRQEGLIRGNAFRINLKPGVQSAATGFPDSLSPVEFGATTNLVAPQLTTWVGNNQQSLADSIMVFDPDKGSFVTYYLRADGITWRASGSTLNLSTSKILKPNSIFMIKRRHADDQGLVPRPY
jgi:hypothetical protein